MKLNKKQEWGYMSRDMPRNVWLKFTQTEKPTTAAASKSRLASRMRLFARLHADLTYNYQKSHEITSITINGLQSSVIVMLVCDI